MDEHPDIGRAGLILQHEDAAPPALFADWCESRGISYEVLRVWEDGLPDDPRDHPWICSLGSDHSAGRRRTPRGGSTRRFDSCDERSTPTYPCSACASAVRRWPRPPGRRSPPPILPRSAGSRSRPTLRTRSRPARGPTFTTTSSPLAAGAVEIARSPAGTAAFRLGRHLGLQFHPEATPANLRRLVRERGGATGGAGNLAVRGRRRGQGGRTGRRGRGRGPVRPLVGRTRDRLTPQPLPAAEAVEVSMRLEGVEPPRPCEHGDLNAARLPVPPQPREIAI